MYNSDNNEGEGSANEQVVLDYEKPLEFRPDLRVASSPSARSLGTEQVKMTWSDKRRTNLRFVKDTRNSEQQWGQSDTVYQQGMRVALMSGVYV